MITDIRQAEFCVPPLSDVAHAVEHGLGSNYAEVDVSVLPCPDLRNFGCAFPGLGGDPFLMEIGGEPLVHNPRYRDEGNLDLRELLEAFGRPRGKLLGAGFPSLVATRGKCGELMPCMELHGINLSRLARVGTRGECIVEDYPSHLHGGLGNLYVCDGLPGDVVRVDVRRRTGDEGSLPLALRASLQPLVADTPGKEIALGGVFLVEQGKVRSHVSPDFDCVPFPYYDQDEERVVRPDFLRFYDGIGPELMCMSVLWTGDPSEGALNLRPTGEHTHFFSTRGRNEGGHYHYDITPETIHYVGYFHPARLVVRVADIYAALGKGPD